MIHKIGKQTLVYQKPVSIIETATITGPKEGKGPLGKYFDQVSEDITFGEKSWEKSESKLVADVLKNLLKKSDMTENEIDFFIGGDLLNQSTATNFALREFDIPILGIFSACSTFSEAMILGAALINGGYASKIAASASSHFCSAEKTFRNPLELGTQRPLTASWTVTGSGSVLLSDQGKGPYITCGTVGIIKDYGIKDANNMGAAMVPAAVHTLLAHFKDTKRHPDYYDMIITGDLGHVGKELVIELMQKEGYDLSHHYTDCGIEIYDKSQDTHAGGSGCGCAALTFSAYYYQKLKTKELNKILFLPTGALLSMVSSQQGESIPAVAHAVAIENEMPEFN